MELNLNTAGSRSNKSQASKYPLFEDPVSHETKQKLKEQAHKQLTEELKPLLLFMTDDFSRELTKDYPYLPTVIYQLLELSEQSKYVKSLLQGS